MHSGLRHEKLRSGSSCSSVLPPRLFLRSPEYRRATFAITASPAHQKSHPPPFIVVPGRRHPPASLPPSARYHQFLGFVSAAAARPPHFGFLGYLPLVAGSSTHARRDLRPLLRSWSRRRAVVRFDDLPISPHCRFRLLRFEE
jgi:hypothetical protein